MHKNRRCGIAFLTRAVAVILYLMSGDAGILAQSNTHPQDSACILTAGFVNQPNAGSTDYSFLIRPQGVVRGVMLFVDFPDANYRESTTDLYNLLVPHSRDWLKEVSYGRMTVDVVPVLKWYRMTKPSVEYGFTSKVPPMTFDQHRAYIAEAIHLAESDVDFKQFQFVNVVAALGSQIPPSPTFHARPGQGIVTQGIEIRHAITFGADIRRIVPDFGAKIFVHEMGHLMGLPDLYDYLAPRALHWRFAGGWSVMSSNTTGAHYFAYEKLKLGWLDRDQVKCMTSPGTFQAAVTPLEKRGGLKAIMIRTGPSTAYVIEVRENVGVDSRLCDHGVLIYTVDATMKNGGGPIRLLTTHNGDDADKILRCGILYDATYDLRPGKVSNYHDESAGITVELVKKRAGSYIIRVNWQKKD